MKRNAVRSVFLTIVCVLLLASCVTKNPIGDQEYFQGLGLDGEFVITVNADLLDVSEYVESEDAAVSYITERMSRLSLALVDRRSDVPPVTSEFTEFDYYGAIEGDFSKKLVSGALNLSSLFTRSKDGKTKLKFYVDNESGLEVAIPADGIILFSNTDVVENYNQTYTEGRTTYISDEDALKLSASQIGIYVANPRTMIDLGFEITEQSLENMDSILLVMDDDRITVDFRIKSEELASSFSVLIKASYVGNLRREGVKVNVSELKEMFTQELATVSVNGMPLTEDQKASINEVVHSLLDIL
ncbi:MAG: hypothetical protein IKX15_03445 [Spirochaetales bacterium]|nr:hypothetical protein [Spirochaetales bacterium]